MITVVLLNYKRPDNLPALLQSIRAQTVRTVVYLWNNGTQLDIGGIDWQVDSSVNCYCRPRWFMACHAKTELVCVLDDDLSLGDSTVIEDALLAMQGRPSNTIVGMTGVVLDAENTYAECTHLDWLPQYPVEDTAVDIIKGRFMVMRVDALTSIDYARIDPVHDDIAISALVGRGTRHLVPSALRNRFIELPQLDVGLGAQRDWLTERERARRQYFPAS